MPMVSVIMPVYNGDRYVREAIDSVLGQTFQDFELLIVNDGSTDRSSEFIHQYEDARIKVFQNEVNLGVVAARNRGLASARGKYIAMLDCDDIANPDRLSVQVEFLEENADFVMIGSWIEIIDESGARTGETWTYPASPQSIPCLLLFQNYFAQSAVFIRRTALPEAAYREQFPLAEDYDLWARMSKQGKTWNLPRPLVRHRIHSESITKVKSQVLEKAVLQILRDQLTCLGINPTPEELIIHRSIGEVFSKRWDDRALDRLEGWLLKLRNANLSKKIFPVDVFNAMLEARWYEACLIACSGNKKLIGKYVKSSLRPMSPKRIIQDITLFYRSLRASRS